MALSSCSPLSRTGTRMCLPLPAYLCCIKVMYLQQHGNVKQTRLVTEYYSLIYMIRTYTL